MRQLSLKPPICELLGIEYPIIQGGMVFLATAEEVIEQIMAEAKAIIGNFSQYEIQGGLR